MQHTDDAANTLGLAFFGSMTASISHELKNALAIVNENGGLLGDLALLMEMGRPLDPARLKTLSENIHRQVQRADTIIKRLNRFAHSAQEQASSHDIREVFAFTAALAARLATMKGVTLAVAPGTPVMVEVRPFTLENLLWLCLKHLFAVTEGQRTVEMDVAEVDDRTALDLRCGQGLPITTITARVEAEAQPLLASLRAEINGDEPGGLLRLTLPRR
jgi:C4-dicarboxylate-specific signal transduction histidine kinase